MTEAYPRLHARTRGFTLGAPRSFAVSADGRRVAFLRSFAGDDPVNRLWLLNTDAGEERLLVDPALLLVDPAEENLPQAERARRERARESGGGIVSYAADAKLDHLAFTLDGRVFLARPGDSPDGRNDQVHELPAVPGGFDPRPSPDGTAVAYVAGAGLRVVRHARTERPRDQLVIEEPGAGQPDDDQPDDDQPGGSVSWGTAEFVAAEEMGRSRGFWWSPDSSRLLVARVDTAAVPTWYIPSPADPSAPPTPMAYPAAGAANAEVSLAVVGLDGRRVEVVWDHRGYEYLARASWAPRDRPTIVVQSRDQRTVLVLDVDPDTGATTEVARQSDAHWVELVDGTPAWMGERLVTIEDRGTARRLVIDGRAVTPGSLQVRSLVSADDQGGHAVVIATEDPTEAHVWRVTADGERERLTTEPGVHRAVTGGNTVVVARAALGHPGTQVDVITSDARRPITSNADQPPLAPTPTLAVVGERHLRTAVLYPSGETAADGPPLPVLLDPYGGPHAQRVTKAQGQYLVSQWFADQGFAVVITDGRGTPARGPTWERAVAGDLATPVLEDQIDALAGLASRHPRLDLGRVAIRGWSFGGYLAALAVLERPDVFHAAIAGAPVTDWRLYDTHYTERYLGHPDRSPETYGHTSLLNRVGRQRPNAERPTPPLLLICGLADDNVFAAHTLQLSQALFAAGRPHQVLPLPGVTHMTPQEEVAENLLVLQRTFLFDSLGLNGQD